uniref:Uncharacterized protein n=1 Tax=Molossus molossus TaxID=27622 RepID=A0A7J8FS85_MOLMO|nr:hypothetical protein HJG59_008380 [Molossus molossus]
MLSSVLLIGTKELCFNSNLTEIKVCKLQKCKGYMIMSVVLYPLACSLSQNWKVKPARLRTVVFSSVHKIFTANHTPGWDGQLLGVATRASLLFFRTPSELRHLSCPSMCNQASLCGDGGDGGRWGRWGVIS